MVAKSRSREAPDRRPALAKAITRVAHVAAELRTALGSGVFAPGDRLPTEHELAERYGVSRPTLRAALRELEATGFVRTQHGVGTFVTDRPRIRAGLERLSSISDSIRAMGQEPGMIYRSRVIRPLMPDEAERMGLTAESTALEARRAILADGEVVAYSYDLMPVGVFPQGRPAEHLDGSIFAYLRGDLGRVPDHSVAEIHAVSSAHVAWGADAEDQALYLLLDQLHYDVEGALLLYSRTYFIEGRTVFSMLRTV
jgi:GntR family transcriptional regulator